jgi:hypothetical protein
MAMLSTLPLEKIVVRSFIHLFILRPFEIALSKSNVNKIPGKLTKS